MTAFLPKQTHQIDYPAGLNAARVINLNKSGLAATPLLWHKILNKKSRSKRLILPHEKMDREPVRNVFFYSL